MCDNYSFYTTDNFGPFFTKSVFSSDCSTMHKVWVTFYTFASGQALLLDLIPSKSLSDFLKSFISFVSRKGVLYNVISDGDGNFVSVEIQEYMNGLRVNWVTNIPLSPLNREFFERLVRGTKRVLRKSVEGLPIEL